ncbi:MAG: glycosyltransferase [Solirubrobacterales bacterium]
MPADPKAILVAAVAGIASLILVTVTVHLLTLWGGYRRQLILAPLLLALAAFAPIAIALEFNPRNDLGGTPTAQLNWAFIALYLLGVCVLLLTSRSFGAGSQYTRGTAIVIVTYWAVGAISNYHAGLQLGRVSFLLVPIVFVAAWWLRPEYDDAIAVLTYTCIAVCGASLVVALVDPSSAFVDLPTRFLTFLHHDRLAGITQQPNQLGLFAAAGALLAWDRGGWTRWVGLPVCILTLLLSEARGSWLAFAVGFGILLAGHGFPSRNRAEGEWGRHAVRRRWLVRAGLAVAAAVGAAVAVVAYLADVGDVQGFTGRTEIWSYVLDHWGESPIIGHGPEVWKDLIGAGLVPAWGKNGHGVFFEALFTMGIAGVLLLAALLVVWTAKSARPARQGVWLPLALEGLIVAYGLLGSPLRIWSIGPEVWLFSIVLFLDPAEGLSAPPVRGKAAARAGSGEGGHPDVTSVTALLASHNRREKTLECLASYYGQRVGPDIGLGAVLVDGGSADWTADAVRERFPQTEVIRGGEDLYWAGAMALAEQAALGGNPDYLLWLNDDVVLDPDALSRLLETATGPEGSRIAVGAMRDPDTGELTYSGLRRSGRHPLKLEPIEPRGDAIGVETFNGNAVLVPRGARERIGRVDGGLVHSAADLDYGLRAGEAGVVNALAPGTVGVCARDTEPRPWLERSATRRRRLGILLGPKGLPPRPRARYLSHHGGVLWFVYWLGSYVRAAPAVFGPVRSGS